MFTRTYSRRPQPSTPSAAPRFAVQRFIQPALTATPVSEPVERERSEANEGLEEQEADALGLDRVKHALVPALPPGASGAPEENGPPPPVLPRYSALGSRILRQELARPPAPGFGPQSTVGDHAIQAKGDRRGTRQDLPLAQRPNNTGLPDHLKVGIESLSGISLDNVNVHYNSAQPAQLNALAYAQGTVIHVAPGQEQLLPHEAWHVVQQAQGRVQPTMHLKEGVAVNDDRGLEREADTMGAKALTDAAHLDIAPGGAQGTVKPATVLQRKLGFEFETGWKARRGGNLMQKGQKIGVGQQSGYKVESDDDGAMEFIVDPPLEVSKYLIAEIDDVFNGLDAYAGALIEARDKHREVNPEYAEELKLLQEAQNSDDNSKLDMDTKHSKPEPGSKDSKSSSGSKDSKSGAGSKDSKSDAGSKDSKSDVDDDEPMILSPKFLYRKFTLDEATEQKLDKNFEIEPFEDGSMRAHPQFTAGMTLGQITGLPTSLAAPSLANKMSHKRIEVIKAQPEIFLSRMNQATYASAGLGLSALGGSVSDDLKGLVALAASYIQGGAASLVSYPKIITDGFLLTRTDFVGLFHLLSTNEKKYFVKHPDVWMNLVLTVAGVTGSADAKVYTKGIVSRAGTDKNFGPTRREWLTSIVVKREDLMSFAVEKEYEGMGRLGTRTEVVSTADAKGSLKMGGIFEFRAGQTQSLDQSEWRGFAKGVAELLLVMQPDPEGLLTASEKNRRLMQGKKG